MNNKKTLYDRNKTIFKVCQTDCDQILQSRLNVTIQYQEK